MGMGMLGRRALAAVGSRQAHSRRPCRPRRPPTTMGRKLPQKMDPRDRKGDQRRVNGSQLKNPAIGKIGLVPKYTPNPRVLGTVWSSYGGATPTQESPRNKQDATRKQSPKNSARNSMV